MGGYLTLLSAEIDTVRLQLGSFQFVLTFVFAAKGEEGGTELQSHYVVLLEKTFDGFKIFWVRA